MKPLTKGKRNQLIIIIVVTLVALGGLGYGLIKFQYENLGRLATKQADAEKKLVQMQDQIKRVDQLDAELVQARSVITNLEAGMAPSGDSLSWVISTVRGFKTPYQVDIPQFSPISQPSDVNLLTKFPYKQVTLTLAGTAYYHELGRFIADFENEFPHIRVLNLDLQASPSVAAGDAEKLMFKLDLLTLVKPTP
jgi:Tfp pilus assembly protein PilO